MGSPGFPQAGSQIRRKEDGVLGEVYAIDPPATLSLRWPTVPGSYAREQCSPEQFAKEWELTGAKIVPPRETRVALAAITAAILLFFALVLVHGATSAYTGYDPYKPLAADNPSTLNDARALHAKYGILADEDCAAGADEFIRSMTHHRFHWDTSDDLSPRFDRFATQVTAPGVLTMLSSKAAVGDGFGAFHPIQIECNFDTQSRQVIAYDAQGLGQ